MVFYDFDKYCYARRNSRYLSYLSRGEKYIRFEKTVWEDISKQEQLTAKASKLRGIEIRNLEWTTALLEELQDNVYLQELSIFETYMRDAGTKALGLFIKRNKTLRLLSLSLCKITKTSFLTEALQINNALQSLTLYELGDLDITGLAEGLKGNNSLEELCLVHVRIRNVGAVVLVDSLTVNCRLLTLKLWSNLIESEGGIVLARSLLQNRTLTHMNIQANMLGNATAFEFARVLGAGGNRTLRKLVLDACSIYLEGLTSLEQALQANQTIELLRIACSYDHNDEENEVTRRINDTVEERTRQREKLRLEAFEQAMGSETTTPWLRSKLMVVGRGAAGKTNTVRSLLGLPLNPEWDSTVGIDVSEIATSTGSRWKRAHHEDFASTFVHRLAAVNVGQLETLKGEEPKLTEEQVVPPVPLTTPTPKPPKSENEQVATSKVEHKYPTFKYQEDLLMKQIDSKDAVRMAVWDYGGQMVFYTLHHLFLTQYGVYLIVFNMTKLLDDIDESSEYLLFWLSSIKLHAPKAPVILVGTFLDKLTTEKEKVEPKLQQVSAILDEICVGFNQVFEFEESVFCPTSNKDKSGIQRLREAIERETNSADFVQTPVSLKWMRALDIVQSSDAAIIKMADLKVEWQSIGVEQDEEIECILGLFHELGVVLYFASSVRLKEVVITKPEWLLEKLSAVIRDKEVHSYDTTELHEVQLTSDLDYFLQKGIASRDLLEFWWGKTQVDYLVELMRHLMLLSDWTFSEDEQYLIPCMVSSIDVPTKSSGVQFSLKFKFLPQGVFERLCCLSVGYSSSLQKTASPKLYKTCCIVDLGMKGLMEIDIKERNMVNVTLSQTSEASMILDFFLSMMRRIQYDFMHGGLQWRVWVGNGNKRVRYEDAQAAGLEPWMRKKEVPENLAIDKLLDL